jgi:hypothetical protein
LKSNGPSIAQSSGRRNVRYWESLKSGRSVPSASQADAPFARNRNRFSEEAAARAIGDASGQDETNRTRRFLQLLAADLMLQHATIVRKYA